MDLIGSGACQSEEMKKLGPLDEPRMDSNTIVVLLHGAFRGPKTAALRLHAVRAVAEKALDLPDILAPQLPCNVLSFAEPEALAWQVVRMIDRRVQLHLEKGRPIEHIVFIGYSFGGLLVRMTYILACGETEDERWILRAEDRASRRLFPSKKGDNSELPPSVTYRPWAAKIRRIILFAGMNRGWTIDFRITGVAKTAFYVALHKVLGALEKMINLFRSIRRLPRRTIVGFTFRRGGPFISALRWQWLRMRKSEFYDDEGKRLGRAPVIQLLGTQDDLVSPEDNIDLVTGSDFLYLEMPNCGHNNVVEMDVPSEQRPFAEITDIRSYCRDMEPELGRAAILTLALKDLEKDAASFEAELRKVALQPGDEPFTGGMDEQPDLHRTALAPGESPARATGVTDVVFVIHGIRDLGHWTQKVAWRIKEYGLRAGKQFRPVTRSYGYFPMWPFLFPAERRRHVEWLVDQILEAQARHPSARLHYCGHSNGTYLLARALEDYPFLRFTHVVFAGSVVRRNYPWRRMIESGQVSGVLNYVASADVVVGFFPKFFQATWPLSVINDLGGAGLDGFQDLAAVEGTEGSFEKSPALEIKYVRGGHSAAIGENSWGDIANAVVHGKAAVPARLREGKPMRFVAAFSAEPIVVWVVIVLVLYLVLCATIGANPLAFGSGFSRWVAQLKAWEPAAWIRLFFIWFEWRALRFVLLRL